MRLPSRAELAQIFPDDQLLGFFEDFFQQATATAQRIIAIDLLNLATTFSTTLFRQGRLYWNEALRAFVVQAEQGVEQVLGRDVFTRVWNNTGATLARGALVFFDRASHVLSVQPYRADGSQSELRILGLLPQALPAHRPFGPCHLLGDAEDIDTSTFAPGTLLYASPTTAGSLTATRPLDRPFAVGAVVTQGSHGTVFVQPRSLPPTVVLGEFIRDSVWTGEDFVWDPCVWRDINDECVGDWVLAPEFQLVPFERSIATQDIELAEPAPSGKIRVNRTGFYRIEATINFRQVGSHLPVFLRRNGVDLTTRAHVPGEHRTASGFAAFLPYVLLEHLPLDAGDVLELLAHRNALLETQTPLDPLNPVVEFRLSRLHGEGL